MTTGETRPRLKPTWRRRAVELTVELWAPSLDTGRHGLPNAEAVAVAMFEDLPDEWRTARSGADWFVPWIVPGRTFVPEELARPGVEHLGHHLMVAQNVLTGYASEGPIITTSDITMRSDTDDVVVREDGSGLWVWCHTCRTRVPEFRTEYV